MTRAMFPGGIGLQGSPQKSPKASWSGTVAERKRQAPGEVNTESSTFNAPRGGHWSRKKVRHRSQDVASDNRTWADQRKLQGSERPHIKKSIARYRAL